MNEWRLLISISFQSNNVAWVKRLLKEKCCWFVVNCALVRSLNNDDLTRCVVWRSKCFFPVCLFMFFERKCISSLYWMVLFFVRRHFSHWPRLSRCIMTNMMMFFLLPFYSVNFFNLLFSFVSCFSALGISGWAHNLWYLPLTTTNKSKKCDCFWRKNTHT